MRQIHRLFRLAEKFEGFGADLLWLQFHAAGFHSCLLTAAFGGKIGAKCRGLEGRDPRRLASKNNIAGRAALKHLADENQLSIFMPVADAIANHSLAQRGRELRREVAHLVCVWEEDQIRLRRFDHLTQCNRKPIRRVFFKQVVFDQQNFVELKAGQLVRKRRNALPITTPAIVPWVCRAICCARR